MFSKKTLAYILGVVVLLALAAAWIWGNALTIFLNCAVLAMIVYYAVYVSAEEPWDSRIAAAERATGARDEELRRARRTALFTRRQLTAVGLLAALYLGSIFCIHLFLRPGGKRPYFLNTDYHAIQSLGVRAPKNLVLATDETSATAPGLWTSERGSLRMEKGSSAPVLHGRNFFEPIFEDTTKGEPQGFGPFAQTQRFYAAVNFPWDADVRHGATLRAGATSLRLQSIVVEDTGRFWQGERLRTTIRGSFETADPSLLAEAGLTSPLRDTFLLRWPGAVATGLPLRDLLVSPEEWTSGNLITRQVLEGWLTDVAPVTLLARCTGTDRAYALFPSAKAVAAGCTLTDAAGAVVPLRTEFSHTTTPAARLYRGLGDEARAFTIASDEGGGVRLAYAWPRAFSLRLAGRTGEARKGTAAVRNLATHWSAFLSTPLEEGLLFSEDLRPSHDANITAHLSYVADRPGVPLRPRLYDGAAGKQKVVSAGEVFSLRSAGGLAWEFGLVDFSEGLMGYQKICWSLTAIFLAMIGLLLFFRREALDRIEPPLLFLLYALLVVRYILLWRVSTFPPAEDASPKELYALREADKLFGLPLTLSATLVFLAAIAGYRFWRARKSATAGVNTNATSSTTASSPATETRGWKASLNKLWSNRFDRIVVQHALVLVGCAVLFRLAGAFGIEFLKRVVSIAIPVASYLYFCGQLRKLGEKPAPLPKAPPTNAFLRVAQRFFLRLYDSREALLSLLTFGALFLLDRGFGILFLLFLLLKTVVVSFARKPLVDYVERGARGIQSTTRRGSFWKTLFRPENYWLYGLLALAVYIAFLADRALFHRLLIHRWWMIAGLWALAIAVMLSVVQSVHARRTLLIAMVAPLLLVALFWRKADHAITDEIKHVRHRAALIHEPVEKSIAAQPYNSFDERRILETAESQWFINSYQNLPYRPSRRINLRPHFDRGVTYLTQTRDVLLPRFVIAEHGSLTMMWLLVLLTAPVVIYFLSYRLTPRKDDSGAIRPEGYAAALAVLLLATIGLFVWLTSTARFVFFGQDFPMLSVSSKVTVLLPLLLIAVVLVSRPARAQVGAAPLSRKGLTLAALAVGLVIVIAVTGRSNYQNEETFTVRMKESESLVNGPVESLLQFYQDSVQNAGRRVQMGAAMRWLRENAEFRRIVDTASPYTASILQRLTARPISATQPSSPVYLRYDGEDGRYSVSFNRSLYRELPVYESHAEWAGDVYEWGTGGGASVTLPDGVYAATGLPYAPGAGPVRVAVIPAEWMAEKTVRPLALVSVENTRDGASALLRILSGGGRAGTTQNVRGWTQELPPGALAYAEWGGKPYPVRYSAAAGRPFASNHLINGHRRLLYPLADRCNWAAQYARAATAAWSVDTMVDRPAPVTLDYALTDSVARYLERTFGGAQRQPKNSRFGVVAADGEGRVRLMADWAVNRQPIDPNNGRAVAKLESDYFFRTNPLLERDQWGNVNLLHFAKGPGSSIKPVVAAAVASQLAVEWSAMGMVVPVGEGFGAAPRGGGELRYYAGLKLNPTWQEGHAGDFVGADFQSYLAQSNNLYHSLFLFLGSYTKDAYARDGRYSLRHLLDARAPARGRTPTVTLGGASYGLPQWGRGGGAWPRTNAEAPRAGFFGNEESLLSRGLSLNFGLYTGDADKTDYSLAAAARAAFGDAAMLDTLRKRPVAGYTWSFPAASEFLQALRTSSDPSLNFNNGIRNATLGGAPLNTVTPLKMAEMYGRLALQDRSYALHIAPRADVPVMPFVVDETWRGTSGGYTSFVRDEVLRGMQGVLESGTGARSGWPGGAKLSAGGQTFFCYAKTGTISERSSNTGAGNSRRFALIISTENLRGERASAAKIYSVFFTADKMRTAGEAMNIYREILRMLAGSRTFQNYMRSGGGGDAADAQSASTVSR